MQDGKGGDIVVQQIQMELDIAAEDFSEREKRLIQHLRDYRTIDADIRAQQRLAEGFGLLSEPRITPAAPERDYLPMVKHMKLKRTQSEIEIAATVERHINPSNFGNGYASALRVARELRGTFSDDPEEDARLQDAYALLTERHRETFDEPKLTDTEQVAERRIEERERAQERLELLEFRKNTIAGALADMSDFHREWYLILWHKYVMGVPYNEVCQMILRKGKNGESPLTPDEYRLSRKKALQQFDKWTPGLV